MLSPIFTSGKLKAIMSTVHDSTDDFVEYLNNANKDDLEVKNLMQIYERKFCISSAKVFS